MPIKRESRRMRSIATGSRRAADEFGSLADMMKTARQIRVAIAVKLDAVPIQRVFRNLKNFIFDNLSKN
jgi:hypothetical protein